MVKTQKYRCVKRKEREKEEILQTLFLRGFFIQVRWLMLCFKQHATLLPMVH